VLAYPAKPMTVMFVAFVDRAMAHRRSPFLMPHDNRPTTLAYYPLGKVTP
jgi:hypothetical protein